MTIKAINRKEVGVTITQIPTGMRLLKQAGCGDPNALASLSLFGGSVFTGTLSRQASSKSTVGSQRSCLAF